MGLLSQDGGLASVITPIAYGSLLLFGSTAMTLPTEKKTLLKNGRVIDPASGFDAIANVLVVDGKIAAVGAAAGAEVADAEVIDVSGCLVTPGLIDIHTHCFVGLGDFCLPADMMGVHSGVPVIVDAGTAGATIFGLARRAVIDHPDTKTKVLAFMDPCQIYLANKGYICHQLEIAADLRNLDPEVTLEALEANRDVIVGFKVRATYTDNPKVSPFLEMAKEIGKDLPIMIHLGTFPHTPVIDYHDLLDALRPGDIITHAFRGGGGQLDAKGEPTPQFISAVERGVVLDIGHSGGDFHIPTALRLMERGFRPNTISTDLNVFNVDGPVFSMSTTMTKIWALGASLTEVISMNTVGAAAAIRKSHEYGTLGIGRSAEVSVLRIEEGDFVLTDGHETMRTDQRLRAVGCLRAGEWFDATHDRIRMLEAAE
ncbi:amidohydrolase/deacetylase family metallohydrolase [Parvibaculum sedimenti]|uniref:Amidohydrolase/deacetylase family metallohydrolase n=2 Tax=Parvibaculum sedimenti TaxID=2608632 RepID=A0A6N6VMY7_9HYPH|nr:amidohydrolase/deacetylase family metallohydrolase [Parvibaculum sedimenti]